MPGVRSALTLICVSLAATSAVAEAAAGQVPAPGTYRLWLCAVACTPADSDRAVGVATIVIVDDVSAASQPVQSVFSRLRPTGWKKGNSPVDNACFSVSRRESRVGTEELFFGIQPKGTTRWEYSADDGYSMRVYASPDAGYRLRWAEPGALARGEGWSYGWAPNTPYHRNAYFAATRIGEPDVAQCS